jgi:SAM-dependent methyltransferase
MQAEGSFLSFFYCAQGSLPSTLRNQRRGDFLDPPQNGYVRRRLSHPRCCLARRRDVIVLAWFLRALRAVNDRLIFPYRRRRLADILTPHIGDARTALDVGSSIGMLAREIQDRTGTNFTGVDIHIFGETWIPVTHYDGRKLPFDDNSFDVVTIVDVLHHTEDPRGLLTEAKRVARDRVLIKDHYFENKIDKVMLKLIDYLGNRPYGIVLPYNFLSLEEWLALFRDLGLRIIEERSFKLARLDPCKHVLYLLRKEPAGRR